MYSWRENTLTHLGAAIAIIGLFLRILPMFSRQNIWCRYPALLQTYGGPSQFQALLNCQRVFIYQVFNSIDSVSSAVFFYTDICLTFELLRSMTCVFRYSKILHLLLKGPQLATNDIKKYDIRCNRT
jgi:hypothetical protein